MRSHSCCGGRSEVLALFDEVRYSMTFERAGSIARRPKRREKQQQWQRQQRRGRAPTRQLSSAQAKDCQFILFCAPQASSEGSCGTENIYHELKKRYTGFLPACACVGGATSPQTRRRKSVLRACRKAYVHRDASQDLSRGDMPEQRCQSTVRPSCRRRLP